VLWAELIAAHGEAVNAQQRGADGELFDSHTFVCPDGAVARRVQEPGGAMGWEVAVTPDVRLYWQSRHDTAAALLRRLKHDLPIVLGWREAWMGPFPQDANGFYESGRAAELLAAIAAEAEAKLKDYPEQVQPDPFWATKRFRRW
jgi:hypothetical protein